MSFKALSGFVLTALFLGFYGNHPFMKMAEAGPADERLDRQILIFERVLDDMLVESPNFLVQSRNPTLGTYVGGQGAVFTFRAGLNDGHHGDSWNWRGKEILEHFFGDDHDRDSDDGRWREHREKEQKELYEHGKKEIVRTLQDFGGLLSGLDNQDWLEIKVRLRGSEYFRDHDLRHLNVRVKIQDIRDYTEGVLDAERLQSRVEMEES